MQSDIRSFKDLDAWKVSIELVLISYELAKRLPLTERFELSAQIRRAAVSVPANIAEGFKKRGKLDKLRFYNIAQGSVEESRYYPILTKDLEYGDISELSGLLEEVSKLLEAYSQAILDSDS